MSLRISALLAALCCAATCFAAGQQFATLRDLQLESGAVLPECRIGYRTYGKLNAGKSNAVLFPTWFGGTTADLESLVGRDGAVDDSALFVVTVDALGNGVSCSPSLAQGDFPAVGIGDMVHSQYRLLTEHFGIRKLHAVMGISMGGMQTFEWMVRYPDFMERAMPVIGSTRLTGSDLLLWQAELSVIEYATGQSCANPRAAMEAVRVMHAFAITTPARRNVDTPPERFAALMADIRKNAGAGMHPLDWAAQLRAMMGHDISRKLDGSMAKAAAAVRAKTLVIVATQDHMVHPGPATEFARAMGAGLLELQGDCGHLAISCEQDVFRQKARAFLGN